MTVIARAFAMPGGEWMPRKRIACNECGELVEPGSTTPSSGVRCRPCRQAAVRKCVDCGCKVASDVTRCRTCREAYLDRTSAHRRHKRRGGARRLLLDGVEVPDPRQTRAWRKLKDEVVYEEPLCSLHLGGCTGWSETADHVIPVVQRPDLCLVRLNLRGACRSCNQRRGPRGGQPLPLVA